MGMLPVPDWYPLLLAADVLKVPPWELLERPIVWQRWAVAYAAAKVAAEGGALK